MIPAEEVLRPCEPDEPHGDAAAVGLLERLTLGIKTVTFSLRILSLGEGGGKCVSISQQERDVAGAVAGAAISQPVEVFTFMACRRCPWKHRITLSLDAVE